MATGANEAAFPRPYSEEQPGDYKELAYSQAGMTMREWYAGMALQGILANSDLPDLFKNGFSPHKAAEICFECADAMLKAAKAK